MINFFLSFRHPSSAISCIIMTVYNLFFYKISNKMYTLLTNGTAFTFFRYDSPTPIHCSFISDVKWWNHFSKIVWGCLCLLRTQFPQFNVLFLCFGCKVMDPFLKNGYKSIKTNAWMLWIGWNQFTTLYLYYCEKTRHQLCEQLSHNLISVNMLCLAFFLKAYDFIYLRKLKLTAIRRRFVD